MPKGYVYVRYSTAEQGSGDSHGRQLRLAREFVQKHQELQIELIEDPIYIDEGVSSFHGGNLAPDKALARFIRDLDIAKVPRDSFLLVESLDRISRQEIPLAQRVLLEIINKGVRIATTSSTESRIYDGNSGLIDLIVMLTSMERAHSESALKSRRVKAAWIMKHEEARQKKIITRVCPSWLTVSDDGKEFCVDESKAEVVRLIFSCAVTMGYQAIARYLNEQNIATFSKKSNGWQSSVIVKILRNPAVIGTYQPQIISHVSTDTGIRRRPLPDGLPIEGYYPAIVESDVYHRVQLKITSRSTGASGRKGPTLTNLFSHVAKCGWCGANMVFVGKGGGPRPSSNSYLVCTIARRGAGCKYFSWPYESLEQAFLSHCQNIDLSELVPEQASDQQLLSLRLQLQALYGSHAELKRTLARSVGSIANNGGDIPKNLQTYILDLEQKEADVLRKIQSTESLIKEEEEAIADQKKFPHMFRELIEKLATASDSEKLRLRSGLQQVIRSSISDMTLHEAGETLHTDWAAIWGSDMPKIHRYCTVMFRVGIGKVLYFNRKHLVYVMDHGETYNDSLGGQRIPVPSVRRKATN